MKWAAGILTCLNCGEDHAGVWPVGYEPLSCPFCETGICVPEDGAGFGDIPFSNEKPSS